VSFILPQDAKVMPMQQQQVADHPMLMKSASAGWCSPYAQGDEFRSVFSSPEGYVTDQIEESCEGA
jgi:hypothetical protein